MNWTNPFTLKGVKVKTTGSDPFPLSQIKLIKFEDGSWNEFGSLSTGAAARKTVDATGRTSSLSTKGRETGPSCL